MKIEITRPTIAKKRGAMPGDVLEVSLQEGMQLIGAGKAIAVKETVVETTDQPMTDVETSAAVEPAPAVVDEKPKRGKTKKVSD